MCEKFATVLVASSVLFREGLARILSETNFRIVRSAASVDESIFTMLSQHQSVLLVIGVGNDPVAATTQIELFKEKQPSGRVAVLADHYHLSDVLSTLRAGANAYLVEVTSSDAFIKSLELVMLGETIVASEIIPFILGHKEDAFDCNFGVNAEALAHVESKDAPRLSAQERRILHYLVGGDSNKVIARKIDIADATVRVHIKAILRKIRVHNRTQAAVWAMSNGFAPSVVGTS
jgi:DNA-binding NarL/FixJ family response regulator